MRRSFGFVADPTLTTRQNILRIISSTDRLGYPTKSSFHDLTLNGAPHKSAHKLLGLNLNYCLAKGSPDPSFIPREMNRIRRKFRIQSQLGDQRSMPELFCPKQGWNPNRSDAYTEVTINEFESKLKELFRAHRPRLRTNNLTRHLWTVLQTLRDDHSIVILAATRIWARLLSNENATLNLPGATTSMIPRLIDVYQIRSSP